MSQIGDGGTADAIRWTRWTGELVKGSDHVQKGFDMLKYLRNTINNQTLRAEDLRIAESLVRDLENALWGLRP